MSAGAWLLRAFMRDRTASSTEGFLAVSASRSSSSFLRSLVSIASTKSSRNTRLQAV